MEEKLLEFEKKIDAIYVSVEKTRKYFMGAIVLSILMFVLPLIGLLFAIPYFLNTLAGYQDLLL